MKPKPGPKPAPSLSLVPGYLAAVAGVLGLTSAICAFEELRLAQAATLLGAIAALGLSFLWKKRRW